MIYNRKRFEQWLPAKFDGEFVWDFLQDAFVGTKIMPMDFDAVTERFGHLLIFETKSAGKEIELGQSITLTACWKEKACSVIHVEGKTAPEITGFSVYSEWDEQKSGNVGERAIQPKNAMDLLFAVRVWFCRASSIKVPTRKEWDNSLWVGDYEEADGSRPENRSRAKPIELGPAV